MKKVISLVLTLLLVLTIVASAMPSYQNNSVKMNDAQMAVSVGGDDYYCFAAGVIAGAAFVTGNWWATAGAVLGAYGHGCF